MNVVTNMSTSNLAVNIVQYFILSILRWIFRKWEGIVGTGWSWLRIGTGGGHL
jgi:hypothetical protein